jgi:hypothetical protein
MIDFVKLLNTPWKLFGELYQFVKDDFIRISNEIWIKTEARNDYEKLSIRIFNCFMKIYGQGNDQGKDQLVLIIEKYTATDDDYTFLCISMLKAIAEYMGKTRLGEIKQMGSIKTGKLTVTPRPANPIYESLSKPIRKPERIGVNIHNLADFFQEISVIEEMNPKIVLRMPDPILKRSCRYIKRRIQKGLKIGISPFLRAGMEFKTASLIDEWPDEEPTPFWFEEVKNIDVAKDRILCLLDQCVQQDVNILVLPELTIDPTLLEALRDWLCTNNRELVSSGQNGLVMVVAGSFHVRKDNDDICNLSTVLNHGGQVLWRQGKQQPFSVDQTDVQKTPELKRLIRISNAGGYERIKSADHICCVDTPLGRICVCICLDFIHPDNLNAFRHSGINVFLVPAMSYGNIRFQQAAWTFGGTNSASSFVAFGSFLQRGRDDTNHENVSFHYLPDKNQNYHYAMGEHIDLLTFEVKVNKR